MPALRLDATDRELRQRLRSDAPPDGRRCGIEHEFTVQRDGTPVDFGPVLAGLDLSGARLDPNDPNAHRLAWGGVITRDGAEAEVVTPPVMLGPGSAHRIAALARRGREELAGALQHADESFALTGYSTHLNVEARDARTVRAARHLVSRFSPALMLLMDRSTSPGLLVRPRPHRLEVCGEYVDHHQLRGALTFFTAAADAAVACTRGRAARAVLPPEIQVVLRPSDERYGWYVDRRAFGVDLYSEGRSALLQTRRGSIRAGELLELAWDQLRPRVAAFSTTGELEIVDRLVDGRAPLPLESPDEHGGHRPSPEPAEPTEHGAILGVRVRGPLRITATAASWDATLFRVESADRSCIVNIPDRDLRHFLVLLDAGDLDEVLARAVSSRDPRRVLASTDQTSQPGIFDRVGDPSVIGPAERDLQTGRAGGGGADRRDKGQRSDPTPGSTPAARPKWLIAVAAAAIVLVIAGVAAALAGGGSDSGTEAGSTPSSNAVSPIVGSALTGTYDARIENIRTVATRGALDGVEAVMVGSTVTYPPPFGPPQSATFDTGAVQLQCAVKTCLVSGANVGLSSARIDGSSLVGTSPGFNNILARCSVPPPPGAAGSAQPVPITVKRATVNGKGRIGTITYEGMVGFGQADTATGDVCANVLVAVFDVVWTRS